jgi:hypothetical protein
MWNVNSSGLLVASHTVDKMTALTTETWNAGPPPYTLWMFNLANWPAPSWQGGDKLIMQADRDSAYGGIGHKGFYAILNDTANPLVNPQTTLDDTLREMPRPLPVFSDSIHGDTVYTSAIAFPLVWNLPKQTVGNPLINNIVGYQVWWDTTGIGRDDTLALGVPQYFYVRKSVTDTFCVDTLTGMDNKAIYYAIKLIYRPDTNPKITSKFLSRNSPRIIKTPPIGIEEGQLSNPGATSLVVSPNPFTGITKISITRKVSNIELNIYDISGKLVKSYGRLSDEQLPFNQVYWNGQDNNGKTLPAGVYFIEATLDQVKITEKIIVER